MRDGARLARARDRAAEGVAVGSVQAQRRAADALAEICERWGGLTAVYWMVAKDGALSGWTQGAVRPADGLAVLNEWMRALRLGDVRVEEPPYFPHLLSVRGAWGAVPLRVTTLVVRGSADVAGSGRLTRGVVAAPRVLRNILGQCGDVEPISWVITPKGALDGVICGPGAQGEGLALFGQWREALDLERVRDSAGGNAALPRAHASVDGVGVSVEVVEAPEAPAPRRWVPLGIGPSPAADGSARARREARDVMKASHPSGTGPGAVMGAPRREGRPRGPVQRP